MQRWRPALASALIAAASGAAASAQTATEKPIVFATEAEEAGREQIRRLLARYDLDPWIFTETVRISAGTEPHSMPVLTLNTDNLDNDLRQLSIFLHEQAHWHVALAPGREAAIADLRAAYPDAPADSDRLYQHLLVAWIELDALVQLLGEEAARSVMREKVAALAQGLAAEVSEQWRWYNHLVLDETATIGAVVARGDLLITPGEGLRAN